MCWLVNTSLELQLSKCDSPLMQYHKANEMSEHTVYEGENLYWKTTLHLIQNRASDYHFLVPEKKSVDFLLRLKNPKDTYTQEVVQRLNAQQLILTAFRINPEDLKSKTNLIF